MVERFLLSLGLLLLAVAAYHLFRQQHRRRVPLRVPSEDHPVIVYFRSDHCPPCTTQARFLEQLAEAQTGQITIEKVDVEREKEKAEQYGVFTLPTTMLLDPGGTVRHINYGLTDAGTLARQIESVL